MRALRVVVPALALVAAFFAGATWQSNRIESFCAEIGGEMRGDGPLCVLSAE